MVELREDLRLAHRRSEDDRRARPGELRRLERGVRDGHARGGERHGRAAAHAAVLAVGQVVARVELFDFAGVLAPEGRGVERSDRGDSARAGLERAKERLAPEPDRADDADTGDEDPR